jgi:hypothetical protein
VKIVAVMWMACLAAPAPKYKCAALLDGLRAELRAAEAHPIALASAAVRAPGAEDAGERCEGFGRVARALSHADRDVEVGTLDGRRAAVLIDGPHGSGHYSDVTLAVELDGHVVGACFTTSTSGWRNLSERGHQRFGRWRALAGDRLLLWSGLAAGAAEYESLIFALVYRLRGRALLLDGAATRKEIARMGRVYGEPDAARPDDDEAAAIHHAAADAYRALATDSSCR